MERLDGSERADWASSPTNQLARPALVSTKSPQSVLPPSRPTSVLPGFVISTLQATARAMTTKAVATSMAASRSMSRRAGLQVCCRQQVARPSTPSISSAPPAARNFSSSRQPRFLNDLAKILGEAAPKGSGSSAQPTRYKDSKVLK